MATQEHLGKCQIPGCQQKAEFNLFWTFDGKKEWVNVCKKCEREIGDENLRRVGGRYEGKKK